MFQSQTTLAATTSYCGSALCVIFSFINEWAAAFGVILALATYLTSLYFSIKKARIENKERESVAKLWRKKYLPEEEENFGDDK